jgi:chromate transporter
VNIYLDSFLTFFKIGAFTIGGGYAMIPLVEKEVVDNKRWVEKEEFLDILAVAQSAPGVLAVNMAIFIGYKLKGLKGSIITALGTILPSFLMILLIAIYFVNFKDNPVVERIFKGIRPTVVALIVVPVFNTAKSAKITYKNVIIPIAAALLIWLLNVSPVYIVLGATVGGIIYGQIKRRGKK